MPDAGEAEVPAAPLTMPLAPSGPATTLADWTGWATSGPLPVSPTPADAVDDEQDLPLSVILDENGSNASSLLAGREIGGRAKPVTLNKNVLKRHAAVLGGSGSGKTTLALSIIEQLLLRGVPAGDPDRPQGRLVLLRQPGRLARQRQRTRRAARRTREAGGIRSTSPSTRPAARPAGRSRSRCCPTA